MKGLDEMVGGVRVQLPCERTKQRLRFQPKPLSLRFIEFRFIFVKMGATCEKELHSNANHYSRYLIYFLLQWLHLIGGWRLLFIKRLPSLAMLF